MSNSISGSNLVSWKHLDTSDRGRPLSNTVFVDAIVLSLQLASLP